MLRVVGRWEDRGRRLGLVRAVYAGGAVVCTLNAVANVWPFSWWKVALNGVAAVVHVRWYGRASARHEFQRITRDAV